MKVDNLVSLDFLLQHKLPTLVLPFLSALGIFFSQYVIFVVVPNERIMGAVQRIFYFHVGSVMAAYTMIGVLFTASCFYLVTKHNSWDMLARAAASIALVFSSIVLVSGMIWGHSAWNTWWSWEPRLVSFLILWLVLLSHVMLRSFTQHDSRQKNFSAVLGIIASVYVPIVVASVRFLDRAQQLHPQVASEQGIKDGRFVFALILSICSLVLFSLWLLCIKTTLLVLREKLEDLVFNWKDS